MRLEHASFTVETVVEAMLHRTILFAHRLPGYPLEEEIAAILTGYLAPLARPTSPSPTGGIGPE